MSATPEQIADVVARYSRDAQSKAHVAGRTEGLEHAAPGLFNDADRLRAAATILTAQAERVRVLEGALSAIVRISQETDELTELSAKEIIEALVNCEQTARAALKAAP